MDRYTEDLIRHLSGFVTENRLKQFHRVLSRRTRYITVVLEDIYQSQNASAVLRTCDCTGIQDVHVIEERNRYEINPDVTLGSDQWLSLYYYKESIDNIGSAVKELKSRGYRIVATSPHKKGTTPDAFDLERGRAALLFGTELNGLTDRAFELADEFIQIPMVGFTESYNISVSVAMILYEFRNRLEFSSIDWKLRENERDIILLNWLRQSIKMAVTIEKKFQEEYRSTF